MRKFMALLERLRGWRKLNTGVAKEIIHSLPGIGTGVLRRETPSLSQEEGVVGKTRWN